MAEEKDMANQEKKTIPDLKSLRATRLWNVLRFVVVMLRRRITTKRLQKMVLDLHVAISRGVKFGGDMLVNHINNNSKSVAFNDHYEFSCSSTPMAKRAATSAYHGLRKNVERWDQRFLMATMPCVVKEAESVIHSTIPKFLQCGEDYKRYSSVPSSMTPSSTYVSARRSNCSESSEIDRQAEEFIASFYNQMRLQRQDSFTKYREMLARGAY